MKVVLSGYYGFNNVGDEAILYSIIQALRHLNPDIGITVLSNNPEHTEATYGVSAINRWKINDIKNALKEADGLISGGGSLLQDQTGPKSIPYYAGVMKLAQWEKKPVFVYAQGMGPINKGYNKWIVRRVLNKTNGITVRDDASKHLLESIGVKKDIKVVPDPVMGLQMAEQNSDWLDSLDLKGSIISVTVRDWPSQVNFKEKIALALDKCVQNQYNVVFVPMHGEHDDITSREISKMMKEKSYVAPYDASIEEKITIIGQTDVLVGMRLHSLIFASINSVPFIALSYDPKIDAFAELCHQPVAGHVNEPSWNEDELYRLIQDGILNKKTIREEMDKQVEVLKKNAIQTAKMAIDSFNA
jgi:polysaccharide pyruvyl transferase CsaB